MKITLQIAVMFGICIIGVLISELLPFVIPSSVVSMLLLFALFATKLLKPEHIKSLSNFLLGNMAVFFVPSGVGLLKTFPQFSDKLPQIAFICIISTLLTFTVTIFTVNAVCTLIERNDRHD